METKKIAIVKIYTNGKPFGVLQGAPGEIIEHTSILLRTVVGMLVKKKKLPISTTNTICRDRTTRMLICYN